MRQAAKSMAGALYVEVLIAVAVLAVALVPAARALQTALAAGAYAADRVATDFTLRGRIEEVAAEAFNDLDAAAAAAGSPAVATMYSDGAGPDRRFVYLSRYDVDDADKDGNPFTGTEADVMWIRVTLEGTDRGLETLVRN